MSDDLDRLYFRQLDRADALGRDDGLAVTGAPALVARTTTLATYPTTAAAYYACTPRTVLGTETEGGAATLTSGSGTFLALNLGSAIPPNGTDVICTFTGDRWVFRHD